MFLYVLAAQARLRLRLSDINSPDLAAVHIEFLLSAALSELIGSNQTPPQPLRHLVYHSDSSSHKRIDTVAFVPSSLTEGSQFIHFCQGNLSGEPAAIPVRHVDER